MILRLSGADFSASNIGKVGNISAPDNSSTTDGLTEETKTLLSHYSKTLTRSQKLAVQNFVSGLKTAGIWSAIGNLYLPILAGQISETLYNVKTAKVDATPSSSLYELTDKGLASIGTDATKTAFIPINASQQNLHMVVYNTETYSNDEAGQEALFGQASDDGKRIFLFVGYDGSNTYLSANTDGGESVSLSYGDFAKTPGLKGIVQRTDGNLNIGCGQPLLNETPLATDNTYTGYYLGVLNYGYVWAKPNYVHYGLMSVGTALSDEQASSYMSLADAFMSAMGI